MKKILILGIALFASLQLAVSQGEGQQKKKGRAPVSKVRCNRKVDQ